MIRKQRQIDPMTAMRVANPVSAEGLKTTIDEPALELAMSEAVSRGRADQEAGELGSNAGPLRGRSLRGRRARFGLGAAVAGAAALAVAILAVGGFSGRGGSPDFATAAVKVAEANPRLLVSLPGWEVIRADEFERDSGEITFSDGGYHLDLRWYPAFQYRRYLHDRSFVSAPERGALLGQQSTTVHYGREEFATMLSPEGRVFIEVRGRLGSRRAYDRILHSLRPVDVETWLSAMPASTVRPEERAEVVQKMLHGVPLPPDFDSTALEKEGLASDRFQLAAKVAGWVACGWIESWLAARRSGDSAAAARAVDAMSSWRSWPAVQGINPAAWPASLQTFSRQLRKGTLSRAPAGYEVSPDGTTYAIGPAYAASLGCGGLYRRLVATPAK